MTQNNVNLEKYSDELANNAKNASKKIRTLSAEKRAAVLARVAEILRAKKPEIPTSLTSKLPPASSTIPRWIA